MVAGLQMECWDAACESMRKCFGDDAFEHWIAGLSVTVEGGALRLGVSNHFVMDWIRARYLANIEAILREHSGSRVEIELFIDPELFRESRRARDRVLGDLTKTEQRDDPGVVSPGKGTKTNGKRSEGPEPYELVFETLVSGSCNELAYRAALQVLEKPGNLYNPLFVFGPSGVGKTHLLKALRDAFRSRGRTLATAHGRAPCGGVPSPPINGYKSRYLTAEQFFNHFAASVQDGSLRKFRECYRSLDLLVVDDVQWLANKKKTQVEFLHTFNALVEGGKQVVLASDVPPKSLVDLEQPLVDRFFSGLVARIRRPDYETRLKIVGLHAQRLKSRLDQQVLEFLAESIRGNVRELAGALMQLDVHDRLLRETLDVERAQAVLAELLHEQQQRITLKKIHHTVARHYGLSPDVLVSGSRQRNVACARQVAMYLARRYVRVSLAETGKYFGNRNHSTVKCAEVKIGKLLQAGQLPLAQELRAIVEALEE